jgi:hypothetical protein
MHTEAIVLGIIVGLPCLAFAAWQAYLDYYAAYLPRG